MKGIILSAGAGSRLLPLTSSVPKCLVEVGGRAILDHQLSALAAAGADGAVVIGGYRFAQVADHLALAAPPLPVTLVLNPFWAVASSIGSVWEARAHLAQPFCLLNGDTVFDPAVIAAAIAAAPAGVGLLVERLAAPALDDMLVAVRDGRVRAVAKDLDPALATHRSLGVVIARDRDGAAAYGQALEAVIGGEGGLNAFHHAVIDRLAQDGAVAAVERGTGSWQEIDRPEDIALWTHDHDGSPR